MPFHRTSTAKRHKGVTQPIFSRLILPLSTVLFLIVASFTITLLVTQQRNLSSFSRHIMEDSAAGLSISLKRSANQLAALEEILLQGPHLRELLARADKEGLLAEYQALFTTLRQKYDITHFYFHLPNRTNLLRVHKPDKSGDFIDRFTAREAERTGETASGIELGPLGTFTLRTVAPVFTNGKLIGYLELGQEIESLLKLLQQRLGIQLAVSIRKNFLNREQWAAGMQMLGRESNWERYQSEVLIYYSMSEFPPICDRFIHGRQGHAHGRMTDEIKFNNRSWRVLTQPLNDASGTEVGDLLIFYDVTEVKNNFNKMVVLVLAIALVLLAVLYLLLHLILRRIDRLILQQQAKLIESEERHRSLLDAVNRSGILLFAIDDTYTVRYMNQAMIDIFGNVVGKLCYDRVAGKDGPCSHCHLHEVIATRETVHYQSTLSYGKTFQMIAVPYIDSDGAPCKLEVMQDITDKLHMEREREILEEKLLRAQKMETIGLLAGGVAHDLNNILAGIVSYPELVLLKLPKESDLRKPLTAIRDAGYRAAEVVADLLTLSRGATQLLQPHDINKLTLEYLNSPECAKLFELHPDISSAHQLNAQHPFILCAPMHIKKILMNLVTNAAEAIKGSGTVLVTTSNIFLDAEKGAELGLPGGEHVVLKVLDSGPGISHEDVEHIFEPFYTRKVMGKSGTGLGLTVVWNAVQDQQGKIVVESGAVGTLFTLYFPVSNHDHETTAATAAEAIELRGNGERVLVVDDEQLLREIAAEILLSLGYRVKCVSSGEEALEFLATHDIDLVVIDMMMQPGINGRITYEKILQIKPGQKAIIASGYSESEDVNAALALGAGGFIKKPYSRKQLGTAVHEALHGIRASNDASVNAPPRNSDS